MKAIYFSGKAGGGKTATALGIGLKLKDAGYKISYFKPIGFRKSADKKNDDDVVLMREIFELPFSSSLISPVTVNAHYLTAHFLKEQSNILPRIIKAYTECTEGYDFALIDGSYEPFVGSNLGLDDFSLASKLGAVALPVIRADDDFQLDENLLNLSAWAEKDVSIIGCIINNVSQAQWNKSSSIYKNILEERGYPILGVVPRRIEISSPTVAEFYDALHGELLAAPDQLNRLVEEVIIGTMTIESALGYLRRAPNKALITGGDRSDMALTALETSTSVIIFTGGLYPDVRVLSQAEEKGVPVILVHEDTYTTVENLQSVYRSIHPKNKEAIEIVRSNMDQYVDIEPILKYARD